MPGDRATNCHATEQRALEDVLRDWPVTERWTRVVLARLTALGVRPGATVLDVGAAAGSFVAACTRLGYRCVGVEPWAEARGVAAELGARLGVHVEMVPGTAEEIPFDDGTFDVVHASSVMEHVADVERAFSEASRVLRPGGVFWFSTASSMCPVQHEIQGFPLFGWYPDGVKLRIMQWARDHRPELVGNTRAPAIHWFTPWKARRLLRKHGFDAIHDRWQLRLGNEGGALYRASLAVLRAHRGFRLLADVVVPDCSYAARKAGPAPGSADGHTARSGGARRAGASAPGQGLPEPRRASGVPARAR